MHKYFKINTILIFLGIIFISLTMNAQTEEEIINKFAKRTHTFYGTTLPYRLFIPDNYDKNKLYPLVLCLHGAGERGIDNEIHIKYHRIATSWADSSNQSMYQCFVVAPQCPPENRWVDSDWSTGEYRVNQVSVSNEILTVNNLIDSLLNEFNIDKNRLYVTGLSMGGYGTWDIISRFPDKFAAAIPMSGGGDSTQAKNIKHISIWDFHGAKDNVVPITASQKMIEALNRSGAFVIGTNNLSSVAINFFIDNKQKYFYTEYPEGGHAVWAESYNNPLLFKWLFAQSKNITHVSENYSLKENSSDFNLFQNYPNPFNPATTIKFYVPHNKFINSSTQHVTLKLYNLLGQEVATLFEGEKEAGEYSFVFFSDNYQLSSGVYLYKLDIGNLSKTKHMVLIK